MASGIYTFRAENFTLDQQASTTNDSLILSILYKIDDQIPVSAVTVPIARQIYSGQTVDLGRWAETAPIEVGADSLLTVIYQVINITDGWDDPFTTVQTELNAQILPALQAVGSLVDINVEAYTNIVLDALNILYNSSSAPNCSGLVHLHSDQYLGSRLAELTANYAVERVANYPTQTLMPATSGCNTPSSRLSHALEQVAPRLSVAGPAKSSNPAMVIARSLPLGATNVSLFNPADPTKFVAAGATFNEVVKGHVSIVPGAESGSSVTPVNLYALAHGNGSIQVASHDGSGWHDWKQASQNSGFNSLVALSSGSSTTLFAIDGGGSLLASTVAANGTLSTFSGAPANSNPPFDYSTSLETNPLDLKVWGPTVQITGLWTESAGYSIYAGLPPVGIESYWGTRVAGGLILNAILNPHGAWTINWPYNDAEFPSYMMLGPAAIVTTGYPGEGPAICTIGHNGQISTNVSFTNAEKGGTLAVTFPGNDGQIALPGPGAAQVATATNVSASMLWVGCIGTDQQLYVGAYEMAEKAWYPVNGTFMSLGGPFIGKPVIVPDTSSDTNRTFFFVMGLDETIYWKYFDFTSSQKPIDGIFTPAGKQWASLPDSNSKVTLTGTIDPGPKVEVTGTGELHNPASLSVSFSRVAPGAPVTVAGQNFPWPAANQISLEWPNTSTSKPAGAQIKQQTKGKNDAQTFNVAVPPNQSDGYFVYNYTAKSLSPNVTYQFSARCSDTVGWSAWSTSPLEVTTNQTSELQLVLKSQNTPTTTTSVGSLQLPSNSQWQQAITIPNTLPVGSYSLAAQLDGVTLASVPITVATTELPLLQIIDSQNNQILVDPLLGGAQKFTVRGVSFPNGAVSLGIYGKKVGSATAVNGTFTTTLTVPGQAGESFESMTVVASGGGVSASVSFTGPSPLQ